MSLKYIVDIIPEGQEQFYKESQSGQYVLDVEDVVPTTKFVTAEAKVTELETKVNEFRANNIELRKQVEAKVGDVNIDLLVDTATSEMKTNLATLQNELAVTKTHLEKVVLSDSVKDVAIKYGVLESAIPDVLNRAKETFMVKDGTAVPKSKTLDKDGNALNVSNWIGNLAESAPHLFAKSSGAGAQKPIRGNMPTQERSSVDKISAGINALRK